MADRVSLYLAAMMQVVPLWVLIAVPAALLVGFLSIPGRIRLYVAAGVMALWLACNNFVDLPYLHIIAKPTTVLAYGMLALAAILHPGPRRPVPGVVWVYVALAFVQFFYILTVTDMVFALAIRIQWLMLTIAAILLVRCIVKDEVLTGVFKGFTAAAVVIIGLILGGLAFLPSFRNGRLEPLGAPSNIGGVIFTSAAPICFYHGIRSSNILIKTIMFGTAGLGLALATLTASRSTMITILIVMLPMILFMTRRPAVTILAIVIVLTGLLWAISLGEEYATKLDRLESMDTDRAQTFVWYLSTVIKERPLVGLLFSSGQSVLYESAGNPHNAYLYILYLGGVTLFLPIFAMVSYTMYCTYYTWRHRHRLDNDPLFVSVLVAYMVAIYAHGFVNAEIFYATSIWPFMHIFLSVLMITAAHDLRKVVGEGEGNPLPPVPQMARA